MRGREHDEEDEFFVVEGDQIFRVALVVQGREAIAQTKFIEGVQRTIFFSNGGKVSYLLSGIADGKFMNHLFSGDCAEASE